MKTLEDALQKMLLHLKRRIDLAVSLLGVLRYNKAHGQQFAVVCLHSRTVHLATGCYAVAKHHAMPCLPVLVRSMWEADIDMDNAIADVSFFRHMLASFNKERLRLANAAHVSNANRLMAEASAMPDLSTIARTTKSDLDQLVAEEHGPLTMKERAQKVNRVDEYDSLYNLLCLAAHNNIFSLERDHVEHGPDGTFQLTLISEAMTLSAIGDLQLAVGLLSDSIEKTHRLLGTADPRAIGVVNAWGVEKGQVDEIVLAGKMDGKANHGNACAACRITARCLTFA